MSQYIESPFKTFQASAALAPYLRVKLSSGKLALAGVSDRNVELGTLEERANAADEYKTVRLRNSPGTKKVVVNGAVSTAGVTLLYTAASGKLSATNATGSTLWGLALETAAADNDVIEAIEF